MLEGIKILILARESFKNMFLKKANYNSIVMGWLIDRYWDWG